MMELTCDSVVKGDVAFGPKAVGKPNYHLYIAKCPANCHDLGEKKLFGAGIHPGESSVCKAALYD